MQGFTCAAFQQLPAHLRTKDDAALLNLSAKQKWRQCPQCKHMVERVAGCNHVQCRCGTPFCFQCGMKYKNNRPTVANVHGEFACVTYLTLSHA